MLAGCMEGKLHITINDDHSADVEHRMGFDKFFIDLMEEDAGLEELKEEMAGEGFEVSTYDNDQTNMAGIVAERSFDSMEKLSRGDFNIGLPADGETEDTFDFGKIEFNEGFLRNMYMVDLNFDMDDEMPEETGEFGSLQDQIDFEFIITLPVESDNNNAAEVRDDGQTLVWNLVPGQDNHVMIEESSWNILNLFIVFVIALVVVVIFIKLIKGRKIA